MTLYAILGTQSEGILVPALSVTTGLFLSFGGPLLQGSYCVEGYTFDLNFAEERVNEFVERARITSL
jgi:hypothetical protein